MREGHVLFNDALNSFYLRLYGLLFQISSKVVFFICIQVSSISIILSIALSLSVSYLRISFVAIATLISCCTYVRLW